MTLRRSTKICLLLFLALFSIFRVSQRGQIYDSRYTLLTSAQLIEHRNLQLDEFAPPPWGDGGSKQIRDPMPDHFEESNGHIYNYFPVGTSVLAVPFVLGAKMLGTRVIEADGSYSRQGARRLQRALAALLMAGLGCIFFLLAREFLSDRASVWAALAGSLGTQVWSTASRSLWSHGFLIFFLGLCLLLLARARTRGRAPSAVLMGTLLSWMYFVRPIAAISILGLTAVVAAEHRHKLLPMTLVGAAWLAGFVGFSLAVHQSPLPDYYQVSRLTFENFPEAIAGNLISPSRGLLVYVPLVAFVAHGVWTRRRQLDFGVVPVVAILCIAAQLVAISGLPNWWGGYGFEIGGAHV
jgi:hypothetical protein